jgi:uncharacterized protein YndB with AHSA1/START domain
MIAGDKVRVQTFVQLNIGRCFDVFTLELDSWWRRGRAYRVGGKHEGALHLEPKVGGRVFQAYGEGGARVHDIGVIIAWAPPNHFAFTWRGMNFAPSDPSTTVEVWFEASGEGTRVTLEHRGFAALRDDHPVRHGAAAVEFIAEMGRFWGSLVTALRLYAEEIP